MVSVVCMRLKYEDDVGRAIAATAEKDDHNNKLALKDQDVIIKGEIPLDRVEAWWHEVAQPAG